LVCVDGGVTLFQTAKKYFWETLGMVVVRDLYIIYPYLPFAKKSMQNKGWNGVMCEVCILYSMTDRAKKFYESQGYSITKAIWRLYIKRTCEVGDMRQKPFVKIDKTKIAISGQILR
jgi:hypothetical protein